MAIVVSLSMENSRHTLAMCRSSLRTASMAKRCRKVMGSPGWSILVINVKDALSRISSSYKLSNWSHKKEHTLTLTRSDRLGARSELGPVSWINPLEPEITEGFLDRK